jgi:hypothetical protein
VLSENINLVWCIVRRFEKECIFQGTQYYIWKLSDLKENLKTFSLFLFRAAANELWKTSEGTVIAVLNPNILENRYVAQ